MKNNKFFWAIVTPFWILFGILTFGLVFIVKKLNLNYFREYTANNFKKEIIADLMIGFGNVKKYWKSSTWF